MEKFTKNRWFIGLIFALLVLLVLYMLLLIKPMIVGTYHFLLEIGMPFLLAIIISYVLNPVVTLLSSRKVPRTVSVLLIYALFIVSSAVILMNLIPMFVAQLQQLNQHMPDLAMKAQSIVDQLNHSQFFPDSVRAAVNKALGRLEESMTIVVSNAITQIGSTIDSLFIAFIVPFVAFYMLKDIKVMEKTALAIVPLAHRRQVMKLVIDIDTALGNYIRGQFTVCLIVGVLAYVGYWFIDMPYALLLASIVAVFNIIPYLGPFFGAAPALIVASTISFKMVLLVVIVNLTCQVLEGNVISPQVVGRSLQLHPLFIIFALLIGGEIAGIMGLILAVPFFAVIKVIVQHIFKYYTHHKTT